MGTTWTCWGLRRGAGGVWRSQHSRDSRWLQTEREGNRPSRSRDLFGAFQTARSKPRPGARLAPRGTVGSLAGIPSQHDAYNRPNMAMLAGLGIQPSAGELEVARRGLVADLGLRTAADIFEATRSEYE